MAEERLQKILAHAGVASRRASERLITEGRVSVDGQTVTNLGAKADPDKARILVDGKPISVTKTRSYFKVYKPRGVLSDIGGDARDRPTVAELLPSGAGRVFPVGRLDLKSEGLMLLTDDGALAHRLTHPRFEHPKTYFVLVTDHPPLPALIQLREGIDLETGRTAPAKVDVVERLPQRLLLDKGPVKGVWLRFVLREGKKRQIRHMIAAVDLHLQRLIRWSIGPLTLEGMQPGDSRRLTPGELQALQETARRGASSRARSKSTNQGRRRRPGSRRKGGV